MSYLTSRKRRYEEWDEPSEWEGTKEEIVRKVLSCEAVEDARVKMALIKCIRRDIPEEDLLCLELHMKLRHTTEDEALIFFNEVKKEHKKFVRRVLHYMAEEFLRQGVEGVREFRNMLMAYEWEDRVNLFLPVIKEHPELTCELWMTLLALVTDAIIRPLTKEEAVPVVALQMRILEFLENGGAPCRGLHNLGTSILKSQFAELKPDQIFLACDAILHSGFRECHKSGEDDSPENRKVCEANAHTFMNYNYRFFHQVLLKLGADFFPLTTSSKSLLKTVIPALSSNWTPPHRPAVSYLLAVLKLRLPSWKTDNFLLPVGSSFITPMCNSNNSKNKVVIDEGHFNDVFLNLCDFCDKFLPLSKDVDPILDVIGRSEFYRWVALGYYLTSRYDKAIGVCEEKWKETNDAQFLVIMLASHLEAGHIDLVMKTFVELLKCADAKELCTPSQTLFSLQSRGQKSLLSVPTTSLGHWLCLVGLTILKSHPKAASSFEDILIGTQIVLSQLNFSDFGQMMLQEVDESLRRKKSFTCEKIADCVMLISLVERLLVLGETATLNMGPDWDPVKKYTEATSTADPLQVLKMAVQFLIKFEAEIIAQ